MFCDHPCRAGMDDNLFRMGYQGEDGSRARANSRRQPPWQSSPDQGQADYGDGYDAHAPDDSYAGYDAYEQGHDGHDRYGDDGFGQRGSGGYPAQHGGYGSGGYPAQPGSYSSGGYPA